MEPIRLSINARIEQGQSYGNGLQISENLELKPRGFLELCEVLAQFHQLAEKLNEKK